MSPKLKSMWITLSLLALLLAACDALPGPTPESTPIPVVADEFAVTAEGRLVPLESVQLAFETGGKVTEVLVEEGDSVEAGQLLARVERQQLRANLEAAITGAELELISAQQALDTLDEMAAVQAAQAQLELANSLDALDDAEYRWRVQQEGNRANSATLDAAEANLILAEREVDRSQKAFNKVSGRKDDDPVRALALSNLSAAKQQRDAVLRQLNWLKGAPNEIDQAILDADVAIAQALLDDAQRQWETLQDGPDPDEVALVQARLKNAESQLSAAQAALQDFDDKPPELTATMDGTVVRVNIKEGELATPGQPAFVLADFSTWLVETDNLTEIEVVDIRRGQNVTIIADALPEVQLTGVVDTIGDLFEEKRGDITYTAKIRLDEIDPRLRWGMTVVVTFERQ